MSEVPEFLNMRDCVFGDTSDFAAIAEDLVRKRGEDPDATTKILEAPWLAIELRSPRTTRVKATANKQVWPLNNYYLEVFLGNHVIDSPPGYCSAGASFFRHQH